MPRSRARAAGPGLGCGVELAAKLTLHHAPAAPAQRRPAHHDDVQARVALAQPPESVPDQPARAVASDGAPDAAADRHPEPRPGEPIRAYQQQEQRARQAAAAPKDGLELGLAPQALPWAQTGSRPHPRRLARRDALASLLATAFQDELSALGPHPDEEAVRAPAPSVVRLEGALHGSACASRSDAGPPARHAQSPKTLRLLSMMTAVNPGSPAGHGDGLRVPVDCDSFSPREGSPCLPCRRWQPGPFPQMCKSLCKTSAPAAEGSWTARNHKKRKGFVLRARRWCQCGRWGLGV